MVLGFAATSCYQGANGQPVARSKAAPYSRNPPEVDAGQCYTHASDVYVLGMLYLEMLTGKDPFAYLKGQAQAAVVAAAGSKVQGPEAAAIALHKAYQARKAAAAKHLLDAAASPFSAISGPAKLFLRALLSESADCRPSAYSLHKSPYLAAS
jgi:serine/threonine protein kinase